VRIRAVSDILVGPRTAAALIDDKEKAVPAFLQGWDPATGKPNSLIPATSFKGVLRNASERILRSFDYSLACDPLIHEAKQSEADAPSGLRRACSEEFDDLHRSHRTNLYDRICPACRLFGATVYAGRVMINDALLDQSSVSRTPDVIWRENQAPEGTLHTRIGIDRWTGGIRYTLDGRGDRITGATQTTYVLPPGAEFGTSLTLRNFALWQLGLIALALRELDHGWMRLGAGSRKGMGRVKVEVAELRFRYPKDRYDRALKTRPADQSGILCAPQSLLGLEAEPIVAGEEQWFGHNLIAMRSDDWREEPWISFSVSPGEKTVKSKHPNVQRQPAASHNLPQASTVQEILRHAVEQSLALRLQLGRKGFYPAEAPLEAKEASL
jgi:CRISPR/Cas system CSM-associated protein Csm3 (group 7 of RAMP superfamily)